MCVINSLFLAIPLLNPSYNPFFRKKSQIIGLFEMAWILILTGQCLSPIKGFNWI